MIHINMNLFGLSIKLDINYVKKNADKHLSNDINAEESIENSFDLNEDVTDAPIIEETSITHQMRKFEEELSKTNLYDIPTYEDIPPKYQINDDVEIITDKFEREIEDLYEGRR